jgi:phosphatidylethanolamine/phosphatidyl-N-methylethanolamine N-methyltransferase
VHREAFTQPGDVLSVARVDGRLIERLYARWASFYDWLCGPVLQAGRREAMRRLVLEPGDKVLEIGIGTGLTAPLYPRDCEVTGIDVSEPMLRKATRNIAAGPDRVIRLLRMDATSLAFPDESFDVVYAAYVITVVPDPVAAMREMCRVCRVGGHVVLLNHFLSGVPFFAKVERLISPLTVRLGFRADLDAGLLLAHARLHPVSVRTVNTLGLWTLIHCRRDH